MIAIRSKYGQLEVALFTHFITLIIIDYPFLEGKGGMYIKMQVQVMHAADAFYLLQYIKKIIQVVGV